jgi:hypothetical protein
MALQDARIGVSDTAPAEKVNINYFLQLIFKSISLFFKEHLSILSAQTLGWVAILFCQFAPIPTLLAVLMGQSDKLPSVDLVMFLWAALITMFFKALIERNNLYIATICLGFAAQTVLMGLILFK